MLWHDGFLETPPFKIRAPGRMKNQTTKKIKKLEIKKSHNRMKYLVPINLPFSSECSYILSKNLKIKILLHSL